MCNKIGKRTLIMNYACSLVYLVIAFGCARTYI